MSKNLYTTKEVAKMCHVTKETVRGWIRDGRIDAVKPGRAYLVPEENLKKFLEAQHG